MKIRKAKKEDFRQLLSLRKAALKEYQKLTKEKLNISDKQIRQEFKELFSNKKRIMFLIEEEKQIKGFIIGMFIKNAYQRCTYIDDIFVAKDSQGKGFGKMLMKEFENWSRLKKVRIIRLGVRANNKKALSLYKKLGFKLIHYEMDLHLK